MKRGRGTARPKALPVLEPAKSKPRMGRRRAVSLIVVHLLMAAHVAHYYWTGTTISPLEPSEAGFSLRDGAINAGAILLCGLILSTLLFGRFFCGWACHLVAYQDMARWLLLKVGIRPRPLRLRVAFLFPLFAALWLFAKPLVERWMAPEVVSASWHLSTQDFWRTFPGPAMTAVTFLVCGFLIIYVVGSKGFCTYGCPYGFLFGVADKVAPGRIRVNDRCDGSAACTANCSSNVDVAREVRDYGMVIDPGCMKCMDCISVCPNDALYYGFKPVVERDAGAARAPSFDYSWKAEAAAVAMFALAFVVTFQLYRTIPLLLSMGVAALVVGLFLAAWKVVTRPQYRWQQAVLKREGRLTGPGWAFAALCAVAVAFLVHGAFMQYHTRVGMWHFDKAAAVLADRDADVDPAVQATAIEDARLARASLGTCRKWGLLHTRGMGRMLGLTYLWADDPAEAAACFRLDVDRGSVNPHTWLYLGDSLMAQGEKDAALKVYTQLAERPVLPAESSLNLAKRLRRVGAFRERLTLLDRSMRLYPANGDIALELCKLLVRCPDTALRDPGRAVTVAEDTLRAGEYRHADLLGMLAWLYGEQGRLPEALKMAEMSVEQAEAQGLGQIASDMREMCRWYRNRLESRTP